MLLAKAWVHFSLCVISPYNLETQHGVVVISMENEIVKLCFNFSRGYSCSLSTNTLEKGMNLLLLTLSAHHLQCDIVQLLSVGGKEISKVWMSSEAVYVCLVLMLSGKEWTHFSLCTVPYILMSFHEHASINYINFVPEHLTAEYWLDSH